ncbi:MAG: hypothetical protein AB7F25_12340 [Deferribacterales bacterium]
MTKKTALKRIVNGGAVVHPAFDGCFYYNEHSVRPIRFIPEKGNERDGVLLFFSPASETRTGWEELKQGGMK